MKKYLTTCCFPVFALSIFACQTPGDTENKSLATTHTELEEQLEQDSEQTPITSRQNDDRYQRYRIMAGHQADSTNNYSVSEMFEGPLAPLDLNSHAEAGQFSLELNKGLEAGINFAGKYTIVTVACDTACQQHFIINRENGQVLDMIRSSVGAWFSPDSRLFVINPPDSTINYRECQYCSPETYVLIKGKLLATLP